MTARYYFFKAQPTIKDQEVESVEMLFDKPVPDAESLEKAANLYDWQAARMESVLHDTLPGGIYDHLLSKMLERRASHFKVSRKE
jgi:hypothetical protein